MFFPPSARLELSQIADIIGAELRNDSNSQSGQIDCAAPIESAGPSAIAFVENPQYIKHLATTKAGAVICKDTVADKAPETLALFVHDQPAKAYATLLGALYPSAVTPQPTTSETGHSSQAYIDSTANIEDDVIIEAGVVIGKDANIGANAGILAGAVVGPGVSIGRNSTIGQNASILCAHIGDHVIIHPGVRIGQDGFGFAMGPGGHQKIPQIGRVIIQDHVEIGANTTIDRGANRDTIIGEGTKIDNQVQIGHNVEIGRHCVIVAQVGISGSTVLEDYVVLAGQSGIAGHVRLGMGAQVGGASAVRDDVAPGQKVIGYPAIPANEWMRQNADRARKARKKQGKS